MKNIISYKQIIISLVFFPLISFSAIEDEEEIGFESIVSELKQSRNTTRVRNSYRPDALEDVQIHTGVGFVQSFVQVKSPINNTVQGLHSGIQATLGIDLLSRNWLAEASVRSFGEETIDESQVRLREFDLKVVYHDQPYRLFNYRTGFGLAARNLTLIENGTEEKFSTPAAIALFGIGTNLSSKISLGAEVGYRTALVSDTADKSSIDVALKLDAHF